MQQINVKLLNPAEATARERFATMAEAALRRSRQWTASAADAGLADKLQPEDGRFLEDLVERVRHRTVLSPDFCADAVRLANICSERISERGHRCQDHEALSVHSRELYALAEAVDAVLDLAEALRVLDQITQRPEPQCCKGQIGEMIKNGN